MNQFLQAINTTLRNGQNIDWIGMWRAVKSDQFTGASKDKFDDYVPPYKNLGMIFIKSYRQAMTKGLGQLPASVVYAAAYICVMADSPPQEKNIRFCITVGRVFQFAPRHTANSLFWSVVLSIVLALTHSHVRPWLIQITVNQLSFNKGSTAIALIWITVDTGCNPDRRNHYSGFTSVSSPHGSDNRL